jgi:squalene synthase HpnC
MGELSLATELGQLGPARRTARRWTLADARRYCRDLARRHYENFTVASLLLPRALVPHFHAVYAYCRWADDLADESSGPEQSLELLDWWQGELLRCYEGEAEHPVFISLRETICEFGIPPELFLDLLTAFRQDQHVVRYETHDEVSAYCRNSANPVGRLVLYLGRCHDERCGRLSDDVCTGLQLINFCQDVKRDWLKGRVYLPTETLARHGCQLSMLDEDTATFELRAALEEEVARAELYLASGDQLTPLMPASLRLDVALFAAGGREIAAAIRRAEFDVLRARPRVTKLAQLKLLAAAWRETRRMP